jgi:ribosomal-protein-alanine N-acetyltransferase
MRKSEIIVKETQASRAKSVLDGAADTSKRSRINDSRLLGRFTVRRIGRSDLHRIMEIERSSFGPEAWDRKLFADCLEAGDLFLGVLEGSDPCGYVLASVARGRAELASIAVDPAARRRGAASALIRSAIRRLRQLPVARISLMVKESNRSAQACYAKFGFRRVRRVRGYYEDGADGLLMSLPLAPEA